MSYSQAQAAIWLAPALQPTMTDTTEAITALVEEYAATLYRVAYSVTRNVAEAEDAVQETFLRVLRHREKLPEIRDRRVWLVRIVWNVVLDKKRRAKTRPETDDITEHARSLRAAGFSADQQAISSQQYQRILALIDRLPPKERDAILLSAVEELSTAQAAAVLGTTESSIRSRIFRARRVLAEMLDQEGIER
uniref:RNA polymerase sigma factor n=1 Tax=Acidobacterium capsulatum TaxID=33075 RepID=A0A7V4XR92_9BACT